MDPSILAAEALAILRRRWLLIAIPTIVGGGIAITVAMLLPPVYTATARLLVESQQIPQELAQSTVTTSPTERLRLIEQRLMSRDTLLEIANRLDVFANRPDTSPTEIVEQMRKASKIESVALATENRQVTATAANISFQASSPTLAARVANEFVTRLLEQNILQRNQRASGTLQFFAQEVTRLERTLSALELQITSFKNDNEDTLPDSLEFRRVQLGRLQEVMFERESRRLSLEDQRRELVRLAATIGATDAQGRPTSEAQELDRLRSALAQQSAVYAESHPTIRALRARVAALEPLVARQGGAGLNDTITTDAPTGAQPDVGSPATDPLDMNPQIAALDRQIALLAAQRENDEASAERLRLSIERTPEIATALNALERNLASVQTQYANAILKRSQAETGERLEVTQQAERFEIIEQAATPTTPDKPNRPLIAIGGSIVSFGFGGMLAALMELLNRRLRSVGDVERQLSLRPIVAVPYISTPGEAARRRWRLRIGALVALVILPTALFVVDQYYLPLSVVADQVMERTGAAALVQRLRNPDPNAL